MEWLWWFLNIFLIQNIASIDFRGGVITWKYIVTENEMAVTYNLSYRPIDSNNICSPYELGNGTWCGEEDTLGCCNDCNMTFRSYYCTSYNNDYTIGEMTRYIPSYETYDNKLIFGYEACCWKDLVGGGDLKTISMVTKVDLTIRTDTGMVNTSPISAIQPVVRVKQGCSFSIHIQVKDDDGDIVKCRWANNKTADECGGICNGLSGSIMNVETCILSYNATGSTGWYAVALQIEDFVSQSDIDPLSSVSLQFLIFVYSSTETCDNRPSIDTSTDQNGALILILSNTTYHKTIIASTHSINSKISEINTVSLIGMTKSALLKYGLVESQWYINVTWTPKETHIGSHQFCYAAFDTNRQVSDQICITLKVINNPAHFCPVNLDSFKTIWNLAQIDTNVSVSCSGFYTGIISRYCDRRGQWEEPDYSQCTKIAIQSLKEQSSNLIKENNTATEVSKILEDLNIITWNNITSGDLVTSSNILKDIADFVAENTDALTKNQIEIFGSLCNNLLGDNNGQNWEQLRKKHLVDATAGSGRCLEGIINSAVRVLDSSSITGIVKAVTDYSKSFTNVLHSEASIIIQKENIFIQLGKVHSKDIVVPDRTKTSESWVLNSINEISLSLKCFYGLPITGYSSTFYRNISKLLPESLSLNNSNISDVNSIIADFSIEPTPARIYYPVVIKFQYLSEDYSNPICVFLNFNMPKTEKKTSGHYSEPYRLFYRGHPNGAWSTVGSRVVESTDTYTICEYTHTTNFAILMSPGKTPHAHTFTLSLISTFGCIISVLFLIITVIVYFVLWRHVRSDRAKILINLCFALITSYILFLVGINRTGNKVVCTAIAVALHYMFLVDFALMLGEGIQVAIMVVIIFRRESILQWMLPLCYVIPAAIVSISAGVTQLQGYGNRQFCWLTVESKLIWAFVAPALFVVMMNMVILVIMIYKLLTIRGLSAKTLQQKAKAGIKSICVIFPLFGITWVLGAFSVNEDLVVFQYLFAVFNSLQGFFICLFHCFLNQQVKQGYEHFQRRRRAIRLMESKSLSSSDYQTRKTRVSTDQTSENRGRSNEEEILKGRNYAYTFKTDSKFYNPTFSQ